MLHGYMDHITVIILSQLTFIYTFHIYIYFILPTLLERKQVAILGNKVCTDPHFKNLYILVTLFNTLCFGTLIALILHSHLI